MTPEQWLSVAVLVIVAASPTAFVYAAVIRERTGESADSTEDDESTIRGRSAPDRARTSRTGEAATTRRMRPGGDADSDVVCCTNCGAENDPAYRYCRGCASELPGVRVGGRDVSGRDRRSIE